MFSLVGPTADAVVQQLQAGALVDAPYGSHTLLSFAGEWVGAMGVMVVVVQLGDSSDGPPAAAAGATGPCSHCAVMLASTQ